MQKPYITYWFLGGDMRKDIIVSTLGILIGTSQALKAADQNDFDIKVDDSGRVTVSCEYASKASSEYLEQIINGPFSIKDENGKECGSAVVPLRPVIGVPGTPNPIAPRCMCPETYEAELQLRWISVNQKVIEKNQQELILQFEDLEDRLNKNNLQYLLNRNEFNNLNQLHR